MAMKKESKPKIKTKASRNEAAMAKKVQKLETERARAADKKAKPSPRPGMTRGQKEEFRKLYTPGERPRGAKAGTSTVAAIAKRFGVTAREARDIATAVGTLGKAVVTPGSRYGSTAKNKGATIIKTTGDIAKQVGETYTAAKKGKSGTSAIQLKTMSRGASGLPSDVEYKTGSKRKPGSKK
jgi:hypothetical protein